MVIEKLFDDLRHRFTKEEITTEEFCRELSKLNDKYHKNNNEKEYKHIVEEIYAWENGDKYQRPGSELYRFC